MVNYKIFTHGSFQPPIRPSFGLLYFKTNICAYVFFFRKNSFFWEKKLSLKLIFAWLICNIVSKFQYLMSPLKHFQNTRKGSWKCSWSWSRTSRSCKQRSACYLSTRRDSRRDASSWSIHQRCGTVCNWQTWTRSIVWDVAGILKGKFKANGKPLRLLVNIGLGHP